MAYTDRHHAEHRTVAVVAVTLIEAAAIFAVVHALSYRFTAPTRDSRLIADNFRITPTPTPTKEPQQHANQNRDPSVDPDIVRQSDLALGTEDVIDFSVRTDIDAKSIPQEIVKTPTFLPHAAKPANAPGLWVQEIDYPRGELHQGHQGAARFSLAIDADGRVTNCTIVSSTGFPALDAATCAKVTQRARFEPATDSTGARVSGSYSSTVRWVIPD